MILKEENLFKLETGHTSYVFHILESGQPEHLFYGRKIRLSNGGAEALRHKQNNILGNSIAYSKEYPFSPDTFCFEMSGRGKGDFREPFIELEYADGSSTCDFIYAGYEIRKKQPVPGLPSSYEECEEDGVEELVIKYKEKDHDIFMYLNYSVFPECDCIVRSASVVNNTSEKIRVKRLMSTQIDFDRDGYKLVTFNGAWAREMEKREVNCTGGTHINSSLTGNSSDFANPFIMLGDRYTCEDYGECYAVNLVYSGNHYESVSVNGYGKTRLLAGINPASFEWVLEQGEVFYAPEAVMTFSADGYTGISRNMHSFVRKHIVRGVWKYKERPVLLNSWEASYFNFDEHSLLKLAKAGKDAGIELFVMDDGWFGERNDDTCSLGDWNVNYKKLPNGLNGIADKINALGMEFGIWVEPEMISENSDLYREHPDWAVKGCVSSHSLGRNQMILDLTREEVRENITEQMKKVLSSANISYVKWDMNRNFSDVYSTSIDKDRTLEFSHRYMLGLYSILETLTREFPHILFEGCASGGNRFDLGMLCYMPQIWASDNTDAVSRVSIQKGYSYGYPQSVIGAHVSGCPNHQTLRVTPLESRFNIAAMGCLGYECNLTELNKADFDAVKAQIEFYKKYRSTLQYGTFYRLNGSSGYDKCTLSASEEAFMCVSEDRKEALAVTFQQLNTPNYGYMVFRSKGLDDDKDYTFVNRTLKFDVRIFGDLINTMSPVHIRQDSFMHDLVAKFVKLDGETENYVVSGEQLNNAGLVLNQGYSGTGLGKDTRIYQDFGTRIYVISNIEEH